MKIFTLLFFFLLANAYAKQTVLVLDTPIANSKCSDKCLNKEVLTLSGKSLGDINKSSFNRYKNAIDWLESNIPFDLEFRSSHMAEIRNLKVMASHGAQTSSVLASFLDYESKFISFPVMKYDGSEVSKKKMKELIAEYEGGKVSSSQLQKIEEINYLIESNDIKVVQMAISTSLETVAAYYEDKFTISSALASRKLKNKLYKAMVENTINFFKQIFENNPNTIFVISAGNDAKDVNSIKHHFSHINVSNTLFVGSLNKDLKRKGFSNFNKSKIQIGLKDSVYKLKNYDGDIKETEGTSYTVAKAAAMISNLINSENLSEVREIRRVFFQRFCKSSNEDFQYKCE
jgi:hypothetical protein